MCRKSKCAFLSGNGYCLMHKAACGLLHPDAHCRDGVTKVSAYEHASQRSFMSSLKICVDKAGCVGSCLHPNRNKDSGRTVYRTCTRKTRYSTFELAREKVAVIRRREGLILAVYECPFCHGYHLTRQLRAHLRWDGNATFDQSVQENAAG